MIVMFMFFQENFYKYFKYYKKNAKEAFEGKNIENKLLKYLIKKKIKGLE